MHKTLGSIIRQMLWWTGCLFVLIILLGGSARAAERSQVMQYGDKDEYVLRFQKELFTRGYMTTEPTGYFGKETQEAVALYQSRHGLQADGVAGPETQKAIFGSNYQPLPSSRTGSDSTPPPLSSSSSAGSSSAGSSSAGSSSSGSSSGSGVQRYQVMQHGDKDDYVLRLQKELFARGYMTTEPTGYFGLETQKAVARYQERHDLESDGKAGPMTQKAIFGANYQALPSSRVVSDSSSGSSGSSSGSSSSSTEVDSIRNGDEGATVKKIQQRLRELGYYTYRKTTEYYGDITESAVITFQKQNGLKADGVVGRSTRKKLFSDSASKYSKKASSSSDSSSSSSSKSEGSQKQTTKGKASASNIAATAQELVGKKYRTGGTGPNTFDCSGFVYYVLKSYGISTPRTSREMSQYSKWTKIESASNLSKGDLVFFTSPNSGSSVGHVGIYLGGGSFIHSSSGSAKGVTISSLSSGSYKSRFKWGRRIFS